MKQAKLAIITCITKDKTLIKKLAQVYPQTNFLSKIEEKIKADILIIDEYTIRSNRPITSTATRLYISPKFYIQGTKKPLDFMHLQGMIDKALNNQKIVPNLLNHKTLRHFCYETFDVEQNICVISADLKTSEFIGVFEYNQEALEIMEAVLRWRTFSIDRLVFILERIPNFNGAFVWMQTFFRYKTIGTGQVLLNKKKPIKSTLKSIDHIFLTYKPIDSKKELTKESPQFSQTCVRLTRLKDKLLLKRFNATLNPESIERSIENMDTFLQSKKASQKARANIRVILTELLTNSLEHVHIGISYEQKQRLLKNARLEKFINKVLRLKQRSSLARIELFATTVNSKQMYYLKIADGGTGFEGSVFFDKKVPPERFHGRGIAMVRHISNGVFFCKKGGCVVVLLEKKGLI